jgi:hypothetical protein
LQSRCDIAETVKHLPHKASPLLTRLRLNGAPVVLATEPWDERLLEKRFRRGPYKSANEHSEFL